MRSAKKNGKVIREHSKIHFVNILQMTDYINGRLEVKLS